jgi:uncharacterized cupredoxin-like copper-binding protein
MEDEGPLLERDMAKQPDRHRRALLLLGVAPFLLVACIEKTPSGSPVDVTLKDFDMSPATQTARAGDVVFHVNNQAPITHEFVVVHTNLPADALPIGPDGLSVNEDWLSPVGELDEVTAGDTGLLPLDLPPGRYVFFCNLEGHYLGGMHGVLEVTA